MVGDGEPGGEIVAAVEDQVDVGEESRRVRGDEPLRPGLEADLRV